MINCGCHFFIQLRDHKTGNYAYPVAQTINYKQRIRWQHRVPKTILHEEIQIRCNNFERFECCESWNCEIDLDLLVRIVSWYRKWQRRLETEIDRSRNNHSDTIIWDVKRFRHWSGHQIGCKTSGQKRSTEGIVHGRRESGTVAVPIQKSNIRRRKNGATLENYFFKKLNIVLCSCPKFAQKCFMFMSQIAQMYWFWWGLETNVFKM